MSVIVFLSQYADACHSNKSSEKFLKYVSVDMLRSDAMEMTSDISWTLSYHLHVGR